MSTEIDEVKELLEQTTHILNKVVDKHVNCEERIFSMIEKSESRIGNINEMVGNLIGTIKALTDTYAHHIDQVCNNRDNVFKQNTDLLARAKEMENELAKERERYDKLMCQFTDLTKTMASKNNNTFNM